jgi:hypothetical protein
MARPRKRNSDTSLGNIGLKPEEDVKLKELLEDKDISLRMLCRALVRKWVKNGGSGLLEYTK